MAFAPPSRAITSANDRPATARLRAGLLIADTAEELVSLFADALAEHGIGGHFCVTGPAGALVPILGDAPALIGDEADVIVVEARSVGARMLLARPEFPLAAEALARVRGYAELYAAQALALRERADDVETGCGLSLRQRCVLGRRLAGLAPIDIARESNLSVATISAALDDAVSRLGSPDLASAIALASRRGWLAVTNFQSPYSSHGNLTYKVIKNG